MLFLGNCKTSTWGTKKKEGSFCRFGRLDGESILQRSDELFDCEFFDRRGELVAYDLTGLPEEELLLKEIVNFIVWRKKKRSEKTFQISCLASVICSF